MLILKGPRRKKKIYVFSDNFIRANHILLFICKLTTERWKKNRRAAIKLIQIFTMECCKFDKMNSGGKDCLKQTFAIHMHQARTTERTQKYWSPKKCSYKFDDYWKIPMMRTITANEMSRKIYEIKRRGKRLKNIWYLQNQIFAQYLNLISCNVCVAFRIFLGCWVDI